MEARIIDWQAQSRHGSACDEQRGEDSGIAGSQTLATGEAAVATAPLPLTERNLREATQPGDGTGEARRNGRAYVLKRRVWSVANCVWRFVKKKKYEA